MNPLYPGVAQRAGHRCEYCHAPEAIFNFRFEVEHVLPESRQGSPDASNLALACRACNLHKSDHTQGRDEVGGREVPLFNPRMDSWTEHFIVQLETGAIRGVTATGRATVACLKMNTPVQETARKQWMRLGLFP